MNENSKRDRKWKKKLKEVLFTFVYNYVRFNGKKKISISVVTFSRKVDVTKNT